MVFFMGKAYVGNIKCYMLILFKVLCGIFEKKDLRRRCRFGFYKEKA